MSRPSSKALAPGMKVVVAVPVLASADDLAIVGGPLPLDTPRRIGGSMMAKLQELWGRS